MSASISLHDLSYTTPDGHVLFDGLNLDFGDERTGLVGRNGIGKSTLLRLLAGELSPTRGRLQRHGTLRMLTQTQLQSHSGDGQRLADVFRVRDALLRLQRIERGHAQSDDLAEADWTLPIRLHKALADFGLPALSPEHPLDELSGGERTRLALAALVFDVPDFLILDEPTNHMDRDGRRLVAELLQRWRGGAVVVSHDRELLEGVDRIVELSSLGARTYGGNWSLYLEQRRLEREAAEHDFAHAERRLREVERSTQLAQERKARKDSAGRRDRARGGQAKILLDRQAERAEQSGGSGKRLATRMVEDSQRELQAARTQLETLKPLSVALRSSNLPSGRSVLLFEQVSAGAADSPVLRDVSFEVIGPQRIAIAGGNGSGKSTLLRLAAGELAPSSGRIQRPVPSALLDQHVGLLRPQDTLLHNFQRMHPGADEHACRSALARFAFRADAALKPVAALSGGERLRAGLACVLGAGTPPPLLLLDEPTNHLDLDAVAAVEAGLNAYDGALLVVSHDPVFLDAIGIQRTLRLHAGSLHD